LRSVLTSAIRRCSAAPASLFPLFSRRFAGGLLLFANSFAYPIRFFDDVFEEVTDVVRDVLDNGEDLF
jgi:hypothetical protein